MKSSLNWPARLQRNVHSAELEQILTSEDSKAGDVARALKLGMTAQLVERQFTLIGATFATFVLMICLIPITRNGAIFAAFIALRAAASTNDYFRARDLAEILERGEDLEPGLRRLRIGMGLSGLLWGAVIWPLPNGEMVEISTFIVVILSLIAVSLTAINAAFDQPTRRAVLIGNALAMVPKTLADPPWLVLPQLVAYGLMLVTLVAFGEQIARQARQTIILQLRNSRMSQRLRQANAELGEALANANRLADHDALTELRNRRAFDRDLGHFLTRFRGERICLFLIDLDHFKQINDRFGHKVGDGVLIAVARTLSRWEQVSVRRLMGRWGGEEFIATVALEGSETPDVFAEDLRQAVEELGQHLPWPDQLDLSASIGCAMLSCDSDIDEALIRADRALYEAKEAGRNRYQLAA